MSDLEIEWCDACGFRAREPGQSKCATCATAEQPTLKALSERVTEATERTLDAVADALKRLGVDPKDAHTVPEYPCEACQLKERTQTSPYCDDCAEAQGWTVR